MIYHIVTGDLAAAPLRDAIITEPTMQGEVVVIKDVLSVGPLQKPEGTKFAEIRSAFWNEVVLNEKNPIETDDLDVLIRTGNELAKNENAVIWLWTAPIPADMCTYYWAVRYLGKYAGRLLVVNVAGLPFLDDNGKLFFPKSIAEIPARELVKARKLARQITPGEIEVDAEEWHKLVRENATIRTLDGGKRVTSRSADYYDAQLVSFCSQQYQKASKVINQAMAKFSIPTGDLFLGWRLRKLAEDNRLQLQGDTTKALKDFDIKLHDGKLL